MGLWCVCREYVDEERAEKQVAAIMQKTLEHKGTNGRKFFYAISRSARTYLTYLMRYSSLAS